MLSTAMAGRLVAAAPCARNANGAERSCRRLCGIADKLDRAACFPRDADCVATCQNRLDGCRETGGLEESFLACAQEFEAARVACVGLYPDVTSSPFSTSLEQARRDAVACRSGVVRFAGAGFCRDQFHACRNGCAPAPRDVGQCRATAMAKHDECLDRCAADLRAASTVCGDRGTACVSQCDGDFGDCPGQAYDGDGFRACKLGFQEAAAACRASATPEVCFADAKSTFFGCIGPLQDSAAAAFVGCDLTYDGCVDACPLP
jgi:hypothetical protein